MEAPYPGWVGTESPQDSLSSVASTFPWPAFCACRISAGTTSNIAVGYMRRDGSFIPLQQWFTNVGWHPGGNAIKPEHPRKTEFLPFCESVHNSARMSRTMVPARQGCRGYPSLASERQSSLANKLDTERGDSWALTSWPLGVTALLNLCQALSSLWYMMLTAD